MAYRFLAIRKVPFAEVRNTEGTADLTGEMAMSDLETLS